MRLYVPAILDGAGSAKKDIELPIEFVFFDIEWNRSAVSDCLRPPPEFCYL